MNQFETEMRDLLQSKAHDVTPSYGMPSQIKRRVVMNRAGIALVGAAAVIAMAYAGFASGVLNQAGTEKELPPAHRAPEQIEQAAELPGEPVTVQWTMTEGTYHTTTFEPTAVFSVPGGRWDVNEDTERNLALVGAKGDAVLARPEAVFSAQNDSTEPVPDDFAAWLVDHPRIEIVEEAQPSTFAGYDGVELAVRATSAPREHSAMCPVRCLALGLTGDSAEPFWIGVAAKNRPSVIGVYKVAGELLITYTNHPDGPALFDTFELITG